MQLTDGTRHLTIFGERQTTFQESLDGCLHVVMKR